MPVTCNEISNKSSAVAKMGDRGHNRHGPKSAGGGCCAPFAGELGPHLTQCGLGWRLLPYQVASSSIQPFGHNRHGPTRKPSKGAAVITASMHGFANCRKYKSPVTLTLTLDRVQVISTYTLRVGLQACPTKPCDCSIMHYENMGVWISWNMDTWRSLNSRDSFPRRKFKNWAHASCSPGHILSPPTISFELHAKVVEEMDLEMCSYGNCRKFKCSVTLTLDRVKVTSTYTVHVGLPACPTMWL